jgi:hypothetical protein
MGMMDKFTDAGGMKDRYEELRSKAENNELDEKGQAEYEQLRDRFEHKDSE